MAARTSIKKTIQGCDRGKVIRLITLLFLAFFLILFIGFKVLNYHWIYSLLFFEIQFSLVLEIVHAHEVLQVTDSLSTLAVSEEMSFSNGVPASRQTIRKRKHMLGCYTTPYLTKIAWLIKSLTLVMLMIVFRTVYCLNKIWPIIMLWNVGLFLYSIYSYYLLI